MQSIIKENNPIILNMLAQFGTTLRIVLFIHSKTWQNQALVFTEVIHKLTDLSMVNKVWSRKEQNNDI